MVHLIWWITHLLRFVAYFIWCIYSSQYITWTSVIRYLKSSSNIIFALRCTYSWKRNKYANISVRHWPLIKLSFVFFAPFLIRIDHKIKSCLFYFVASRISGWRPCLRYLFKEQMFCFDSELYSLLPSFIAKGFAAECQIMHLITGRKIWLSPETRAYVAII